MSSIEDSPVARPRSSQGKRDQENGAADEVASKKRKQVRVWVDGWWVVWLVQYKLFIN